MIEIDVDQYPEYNTFALKTDSVGDAGWDLLCVLESFDPPVFLFGCWLSKGSGPEKALEDG